MIGWLKRKKPASIRQIDECRVLEVGGIRVRYGNVLAASFKEFRDNLPTEVAVPKSSPSAKLLGLGRKVRCTVRFEILED